MDTELLMECEEEELEPWQQVDDGVDEDNMDYNSSTPPIAAETPPITADEESPPPLTSFTPTLLAQAPPAVAQAPPLFLLTQGFPLQTMGGSGSPLVLNFGSGPAVRPLTLIHSAALTSLVATGPALSLGSRPMGAVRPENDLTQVGGASRVPALPSASANESRGSSAPKKAPPLVMSVEDFYYGCSEGDISLRKPRPLGVKPTTFSCQLCSQTPDNNLRLMQHLLLHPEFSPGGGADGRSVSCQLCFRGFSSPVHLQTHLYHVHGSAHCTTVCRICEWAFDSQPSFLAHMKSHHKPGEMPYSCQVCSFRSSFYSDVIQHFSRFHKDSPFLMCVFCLRVSKNPQNYTHHLLRHQVKQASHCNRCRLQFVSLKDKQLHKQRNHGSFRRPSQLEGLPPGSKVTIRTYGRVRAAGSPSSHLQRLCLKTDPVSPEPRRRCHRTRAGPPLCLECGTDASDLPAHYPTRVCCLLCCYSSCCSRAYAAHMIHHHVSQSKCKSVDHRRPPPCVFGLRCSDCDFRDSTPDQMAEHLNNTRHYSCVCYTTDVLLRAKQPLPQPLDPVQDRVQVLVQDRVQVQERMEDQYDPSWRSAQCWTEPCGAEGFSVVPFSEPSGPRHSLPKTSDAIDFFLLLFPAPLIELIADQTNAHAESMPDPCWFPVTPLEIQGFLGLVVLMGIQTLPNLEHYWSRVHHDSSATFSRTMSYRRFRKIAKNICMSSWASDQNQDRTDPLRFFRPMLELLGSAMWSAYRPNSCLAVDRALLPPLEKENSQPPSETAPQPEVWLLCDSKSGFCHRLLVRSALEPDGDPGLSVVPELMEGLRERQHQLFLSKSILSAPLLLQLLREGIYCSSSFPPPGADLPAPLWTLGPLRRPGDFLQRRCGPLLLTRWMDTKEMCCLSTNAAAGQTDTVWRRSTSQAGALQPIARPLAFRLLQENMRGVDICKQLLACNPLGGVTLDRHWRRLFWFLVNLSVVNAFIVLRESRREAPPPWVQDGLFTQLAFRRRLGNQLVSHAQRVHEPTASVHVKVEPEERHRVAKLGNDEPEKERHRVAKLGNDEPEKERHRVAKLGNDEPEKERHRVAKLGNDSKRCKNCNLSNIRHESRYGCVSCRANLCKQPSCFWDYHGLSPSNKGSTKVGFLKDRISGEVQLDDCSVDTMMAPVEDEDFSDDEEDCDVDKEDLTEDSQPWSAASDGQNAVQQTAVPDGEGGDGLGARQLRMALLTLCEGVHSAARFFSCQTVKVRAALSEARRRCDPLEREGEDQLVLWVLSMREQQLPLTESALFHQAAALKMTGSFSSAFQISYSWAVDFFLRHNLLPVPAPFQAPPVLESKVQSFRAFVQKMVKVHGLSLGAVATVDELCVFMDWSLVQDPVRRCKALQITGFKPLVCVFLAVRADGTRLPALVLVNRQLEKPALPESVLLETVSEDFRGDDALDIWTRRVWAPTVSAQDGLCKALLVLDQHREHTTEPFLSRLSESNTLPALIPVGSSSHLQPLDICVRPVLQNLLKNRWATFCSSEPRELQDQSGLTRLLVDWIVQALEDLDGVPEVWKSSFALTGLLPETETETSRTELLRRLTEALPDVDFSETSDGPGANETQEDNKDRKEGPKDGPCLNKEEDAKEILVFEDGEEVGLCLDGKDELSKSQNLEKERQCFDKNGHEEDRYNIRARKEFKDGDRTEGEVEEWREDSPIKEDRPNVETDGSEEKRRDNSETNGSEEKRRDNSETDGSEEKRRDNSETDTPTNRRETRIVVGKDVGDEWKVTGTDGDTF